MKIDRVHGFWGWSVRVGQRRAGHGRRGCPTPDRRQLLMSIDEGFHECARRITRISTDIDGDSNEFARRPIPSKLDGD